MTSTILSHFFLQFFLQACPDIFGPKFCGISVAQAIKATTELLMKICLLFSLKVTQL